MVGPALEYTNPPQGYTGIQGNPADISALVVNNNRADQVVATPSVMPPDSLHTAPKFAAEPQGDANASETRPVVEILDGHYNQHAILSYLTPQGFSRSSFDDTRVGVDDQGNAIITLNLFEVLDGSNQYPGKPRTPISVKVHQLEE